VKTIKIAAIGDVHDQWEIEDNQALQNLGLDLALFVGDFGNESVEIVRTVAAAAVPKAVILGNHDAWYTASEWGRKKSPYDHNLEDRVSQQLEILHDTHVGYAKRDFPALDLAVVGGRPFSWGGEEWKNPQFYGDRYQIHNFAESTAKIMEAALSATADQLIFLGHNGPLGLGSAAHAPCGRDWQPLGGDFGDPDLSGAIRQAIAAGKRVPLVVFGHMHHRLRYTKKHLRQTIATDQQGTVYLNCAAVPRIAHTPQGRLGNFSLITLQDYQVEEISLAWVSSSGRIVQQETLYHSETQDLAPLGGYQ
jgi:uncharacterized protein (TIGR04168 family)